jgi:hypothetical protein
MSWLPVLVFLAAAARRGLAPARFEFPDLGFELLPFRVAMSAQKQI